MDFGLNLNVNSAASLSSSNVNASIIKAVQPKTSASSPAIDGLSNLLANATKVNEDPIKTKLVSIDNELSAMEAYLADLNAQGEAGMKDQAKILATLDGMAKRLAELQQELENLSSEIKARSAASRQQYAQMSQIDILKNHIDAQREIFKVDDTIPAPVQVSSTAQVV